MIWNQTYFLFGHGLAYSALLSATPIFTLLILPGVMRKAAWIAGPSKLAVTFAVAVAAYRMPPVTALSAAAYGTAFVLFPISWIMPRTRCSAICKWSPPEGLDLIPC